MKKSVKWVILALASIVICAIIGLAFSLNNTHMWKYSADFDEYKDDFVVLKDYVEETFSSEYGKWFFVSTNGTGTKTLFDPEGKEYLDLPSEVGTSLAIVDSQAFPDKDSNLDVIQVHNERVSFCIENGQYALVYSPKEKPTWLNSPDEDIEIKVKKIGDGWYHVIKNPN